MELTDFKKSNPIESLPYIDDKLTFFITKIFSDIYTSNIYDVINNIIRIQKVKCYMVGDAIVEILDDQVKIAIQCFRKDLIGRSYKIEFRYNKQLRDKITVKYYSDSS